MMSLDQVLANLPVQPGCYLMRDVRRRVLYVGKATSLRNRVRSYFQAGAQHSPRIAQMVCQVEDINYIITGSEVEALILENELIKRYRPRYNIRLRDDKRYPLLKFTREPFPQLVECRQTKPDGARYFGPYTNSSAMRAFERLIRRLYHIRRCTYALDADSRLRPCLDHHLGLCDAPCAGLISEAAYDKLVDASADLLRGRVDSLLADLEAQMAAAAADLAFERAAALRDLIGDVRKASAMQQRVVSGRVEDIDEIGRAHV